MAASEFSRWFLACFFVGVAGFYTVAIIAKRRRSGVSPVSKGAPGSLHRRVHNVFVVFRAAIFAVCVARVPFPDIDAWLLVYPTLAVPPVLLTGNALLLLSFAMIVAIHGTMGHAWRSGIAADQPATLITTGPFAWSRNPMFILIQLAQLGLFLSLPSAFTLICLVVGVCAIQLQVRMEERHLEARFGAAYEAYRARTPRWL